MKIWKKRTVYKYGKYIEEITVNELGDFVMENKTLDEKEVVFYRNKNTIFNMGWKSVFDFVKAKGLKVGNNA